MTGFDRTTTAVVVTYNSACYIRDCLQSIRAAAADVPVMVIDNASSDETAEIVRTVFPWVTLVALTQNIGHSAACNLGLSLARTTWVLLLDHDVTVTPGWLEPLLQAAHMLWPHTAMVSSRAIMVRPGQELCIHHDGGYAHFTGHMTLRHGFAALDEIHDDDIVEVGAQAATSLLIHRERALDAGGFDARFFIYLNDFELTLRMRMRGWRCLVAPRSVVYHHLGNAETSWRGSGTYPQRRAFLIYRNRWMLLAKIYAARTLFLCSPALLTYELVLLAAALRNGWLAMYLAALRDVKRHWPALMTQRRHIQATRLIGDAELLSARHLSYVRGLVHNPAARFAKKVLESGFAIFWRGVSPFLG